MKKLCLDIILFFTVLVLLETSTFSSGQTSGLQCYVGNCSSWEECRRQELITDCPTHHSACLTLIDQKSYGRLTVVKKCGSVSECSGSPSYWWRDECDKRSEEDSYTCTSCCLSTACNQADPSPQPLLALSPLLTVQFLYNKYSSLGWG